MRKQKPQKDQLFLKSYQKNFLSFIEVLLSVLPAILLTVCGVSFGIYVFSLKTRYLVLFLATLVGTPLLHTISERLEKFFERKTRD